MLFIEFAIIILLVRKCDLCYVNDNTDMNLIIFRWLLLVILLQIIIDFFSYIFFRLFISDFLYDMFCTFSWWCRLFIARRLVVITTFIRYLPFSVAGLLRWYLAFWSMGTRCFCCSRFPLWWGLHCGRLSRFHG